MSFKYWRNKLTPVFRDCQAVAVNHARLKGGRTDLVGKNNVDAPFAFVQRGEHVDIELPHTVLPIVDFLSHGVEKGRFFGEWKKVFKNGAVSEILQEGGYIFMARPHEWTACKAYLEARAQNLRAENNKLFAALTADQ